VLLHRLNHPAIDPEAAAKLAPADAEFVDSSLDPRRGRWTTASHRDPPGQQQPEIRYHPYA
jgi:hypothetical protein